MATFKIIARFQRTDGFWPVYIRVTHNRKVKYLKTDKIVETKSVDKKNHEVKDPFVLEACTVKIAHFADMLNKQPILSWSVDDVIAYLESSTADGTLCRFQQGHVLATYIQVHQWMDKVSCHNSKSQGDVPGVCPSDIQAGFA